jgi:cation diffusion facilitator CzcD-associated flavoprotein CzcO
MDRQTVDIAIVGSGFSGLGTAIQLKRAGRDDFVVLERAEEVGGTWWANTYPGCGCDVPSHLYSFSFAPNPDWTQTYSAQPEIRDYLIRCADEFGVRDHIRTGHELTDARWDAEAQRWDVDTTAGSFRARVLVLGTGPLVEPKIPDFPGIESFQGEKWHSARWNHDYDLKGKRVASVGTGASAIQLVPSIQPEVEQLYVVQRTPPWVVPHSNRPTTALERRLYRRLPVAQKLVRGAIYAAREALVLGFVKRPKLLKLLERVSRAHMRRAIDDPELLEKVTPDYTIGCKRILPSNRWYPTLAQDNVELVTAGIKEVRPNAIVTEDGVERPVDAIVFSTGFQVSEMPIANIIRDGEGRTLREAWEAGAQAYLGSTVADFPNLFLMVGPNTGLGHTSIVYMIESQVAYVMDALRAMDQHGADAVEVRRDVAERYNRETQEMLQGTVWNSGGCASWYLDESGRNVTIWPDWTFRFRQRTASFDADHYELLAPVGEREAVPA